LPMASAREAYLEADRKAEFRSEYIDGVVYPMPGSSPAHATLTVRLGSLIDRALESGPRRTSASDLRLRTGNRDSYVYPDIMVFWDEYEFEEGAPDIVKNPLLVAEVLSPSTESWDRDGKFARYQAVESLREYLLVSQVERRVE